MNKKVDFPPCPGLLKSNKTANTGTKEYLFNFF